MTVLQQRLEQILPRIKSDGFFEGRQLGNELNFHIFDYDPQVFTSNEIKQMKDNAKAEMQRERAQAVEVLKGQMVALSMAAAQKIVSKNMDAAENAALVSEFIEQLDKNKIGDLPC